MRSSSGPGQRHGGVLFVGGGSQWIDCVFGLSKAQDSFAGTSKEV